MAILSANTLFHFTNKGALCGILDNGFRASFCLEYPEEEGYIIPPIHIAMICFCDIPLSMLDKHLNGYSWSFNGNKHEFKGYGRFGIGMSKEWGIKNGLNPVVYVNSDSEYSMATIRANNILGYEMKTLRQLIQRLKSEGSKDENLVNTLNELFFKFKQGLYYSELGLCYSKLYQSVYDGRRYYDEKEWRFVPMIPDPSVAWNGVESVMAITVPYGHPQTDEALSHYKRGFLENTLTFTPKDVKYLIVEHENDIESIVSALKKIHLKNPERYSEEEIHLLTTRIITYNQINEDF